MSAPDPSTLSGLYRRFYTEATALVRRLAQDPEAVSLEEAQESVRATLSLLSDEAGERAVADPLSRAQAQYLMVAHADEIFTEVAWPHAGAWAAATLESQLFQTKEAGVEVFLTLGLDQHTHLERVPAVVVRVEEGVGAVEFKEWPEEERLKLLGFLLEE